MLVESRGEDGGEEEEGGGTGVAEGEDEGTVEEKADGSGRGSREGEHGGRRGGKRTLVESEAGVAEDGAGGLDGDFGEAKEYGDGATGGGLLGGEGFRDSVRDGFDIGAARGYEEEQFEGVAGERQDEGRPSAESKGLAHGGDIAVHERYRNVAGRGMECGGDGVSRIEGFGPIGGDAEGGGG
jgi:hypothetical protein